jgi:hypothetical protein
MRRRCHHAERQRRGTDERFAKLLLHIRRLHTKLNFLTHRVPSCRFAGARIYTALEPAATIMQQKFTIA